MSRTTLERRPRTRRLAVAALGAAAVLGATATGAGAATGVVIPLEPGVVELINWPVENYGAFDPMADQAVWPALTPVDVRYGGTITVNLSSEFDDSAVEILLEFDDDEDGVPDLIYSSALAPADPLYLAVSGASTGSLQVTLPADDGAGVDDANLVLAPIGSTLNPAFQVVDPLRYHLAFDAAAAPAVTVDPQLVAISWEPCDPLVTGFCTLPTPLTAGSTVSLDLTAGSVLRELGIADLTGVKVGLSPLDANGNPVGSAVALTTQVTGSTASFVIPAGTAAGSYELVIVQDTPSGGVSELFVEFAIVAPEAAPAAAPTTAVNAGLKSNTGAEVVGSGSTGTTAVALGAGMLLLAGVGGVAVARTRRRPAVEGGTCEV